MEDWFHQMSNPRKIKNLATVLALLSAQCAIFFKIALKMLSKIASKFAHSVNESCLPRTAVNNLLSEVMYDVILDNEEFKL